MLGLRFYFNQPQEQSWPTDGMLDWLWLAAERAGIPVALAGRIIPTGNWEHCRARSGPEINYRPHGRSMGEAAYKKLPQLLALAKHPNIAVKATGQAGYALGEYPFRSIHTHLRQTYDAFGPERMFWGTDITRVTCSWRQCVTLFTEELPWLTRRDLELVMGQAFCDWIG
jgi:hypothetical protein